ncbi:Hypothetical protein DEACI_4056 [Acididesulfobacillus acetoxydans]|uniref:Uncharacterized protein n=1 Tax=Acididesulfobacillus acetoxydans TaxID=1561005 RepID=A0A8S0VYN7_9FIRM|nr:hypothetical protein [Acididesulfobacillus acetoxydans]CAA7603233.1 Hypothetical protein DEACI_4056 [Acididesulfobacillus acetoxydans]
MKSLDKKREMAERRQALLEVRGEILGKYKVDKEQRIHWLVRLMDVEDELEELACRQSQCTIAGKLTSAGNSRRRRAQSN